MGDAVKDNERAVKTELGDRRMLPVLFVSAGSRRASE
jgi:hypothetical protein